MKIPYYVRNVYGNDSQYVANSTVAQSISRLTGCKTLRDSDMTALESLGHSFEQVIDPAVARRGKYGATVINPSDAMSWDAVESARDNIVSPKIGPCDCHGTFHELDCVLRIG